ncbi:FHA domain-containing protein [bacterium]|nr:FHA domain-containing protein [bacterium]
MTARAPGQTGEPPQGAELVLEPRSEGAPRPPERLPGQAINLGRDPECDVVLPDDSVSRRHARIVWQDGVWWIHDLGSANGTEVAGSPIKQTVLSDGVELRIGPFVYQVTLRTRTRRTWPGAGLFVWRLRGEDARVAGVDRLLWSRQTMIGRSETADVTVDQPQVSGLHARLGYGLSGPNISDLGSANGVRVNGQLVREQDLKDGDRLVVADLPFRVQRTWIPTPVLGVGSALAVAMVLVLLLLPTAGQRSLDVERWWTREMYLEQAQRSLTEAVEAWQRPDPARDLASASFDIALRSLAAVDWLPPDEPAPADIEAALDRAELEFGGALAEHDLAAILAAVEAPPPEPVVAEAEPGPEPGPDAGPAPFDLESELSVIVAEFGIDSERQPIPPDLVAEIDRFLHFWSVEMKGFSRRAWRRGQPHLPLIVEALRRHRLPEVFCYLPFIESGYREDITSSAGARGLWQFMPATGRKFGLRVDDQVDERTDPVRATEAACQYLKYLLNAYGANSFMCAVAAYNKGEYGMLRCLGQGADWRSRWKFWDIATRGDGCLKPETIEYVPKFLAAVVVLRRPDVFDLSEDGV